MPVGRTGFLTCLLLSAAVALAAVPTGWAAEDPRQSEHLENGDRVLQAADGWRTYVNDGYGLQLSYPAELFPSREPAPSGDGYRFIGGDARIEVSAWENEAGVTPDRMAADLLQMDAYGTVERQEIGEDRMVLTGRRADQAFYEEYAFVGDSVQAFGLEYPVAQRDTYEPLLEEMAASFRAGDETRTGEVAEGPQQPPGAPPADTEDRPEAATPQPPAAGTAAGVQSAGPDIVGQVRIFLNDGKKNKKQAKSAGRGAKKQAFVPPGLKKQKAKAPGSKKQKAKPARGKKQKGKRGRGKKR
jgi:hypothetical protein